MAARRRRKGVGFVLRVPSTGTVDRWYAPVRRMFPKELRRLL